MIHPTAVIDAAAEIHPAAEIGPYCVIGAGVRIGAGTKLGPHVHIQGFAEIGRDNFIWTGAALGLPPQHTGYKGAPTRLKIGDGNTIREYVTIHRGFQEGASTTIGDGCFLMAMSHVGHDCALDDGVILANGALLGGHVTVGERAFISGNVAIHQFCRVGRLCIVAGLSAFNQDAPPFMMVQGAPAVVRGLNIVGLRRANVSRESRLELKRLFHHIFRSGKTSREAIGELDAATLGPEARHLVEFFAESKRGVLGYASKGQAAAPAELEGADA